MAVRLPNFYYEKKLWKRGFKFVAGIDEVGRGCFAGPVVTGAVVFAPTTNFKFPIINEENEKVFINDSKKLTAKRREVAERWIKKNAVSWGIGKAGVAEINKFGITQATQIAFRRAVGNANQRLHHQIDFLLIDAFYVTYLKGFPTRRRNARKNHNLKDSRAKQLAIVNGDSKSISIAAASIVAKAYRDKLMRNLGKRQRYLEFDWVSNKGYGTKKHRDALIKFGLTKHHRKKFVATFLSNSK